MLKPGRRSQLIPSTLATHVLIWTVALLMMVQDADAGVQAGCGMLTVSQAGREFVVPAQNTDIALEVAGKLVKYSDNGTTRSAVNFPQVSLPDHQDASRILHIHHNEPGVLQQINQVFSEQEVNVASQYLETRDEIGYVVMDVETANPQQLLNGLRGIPSTIRARILH